MTSPSNLPPRDNLPVSPPIERGLSQTGMPLPSSRRLSIQEASITAGRVWRARERAANRLFSASASARAVKMSSQRCSTYFKAHRSIAPMTGSGMRAVRFSEQRVPWPVAR